MPTQKGIKIKKVDKICPLLLLTLLYKLIELDVKLAVCFTDPRLWILSRAMRWSLLATRQQ